MAALRAGVSTVIIPAGNEADLEEIDQTVRRSLKFVTADHVDAILDIALNRPAAEIATQAAAGAIPPQNKAQPSGAARIGQ